MRQNNDEIDNTDGKFQELRGSEVSTYTFLASLASHVSWNIPPMLFI